MGGALPPQPAGFPPHAPGMPVPVTQMHSPGAGSELSLFLSAYLAQEAARREEERVRNEERLLQYERDRVIG